jgi:hypothetical protein
MKHYEVFSSCYVYQQAVLTLLIIKKRRQKLTNREVQPMAKTLQSFPLVEAHSFDDVTAIISGDTHLTSFC